MSEPPALELDGLHPIALPVDEAHDPALPPPLPAENALLRNGDLAVINRPSVNCRAWMSTAASITGTLRKGNKVELLRDPVAVQEGRRTWVKIRSVVLGVEGFVPLAFLDVRELRGLSAPVEPEPVIEEGCGFLAGDLFATTLRLNLRNTPGRQSDILRSLEPNMLGTAHSGPVSADGIDWLQAWIGDETGWLAANYTRHIARGGKWIEVDLTSQTLTAWNDTIAVSRSPVSTGKPGFRTPAGVFSITTKVPAKRASGIVRDEAWDIPGVPWVMVFRTGGFYIHGVYWHDDFGRAVSHGCVTLPVSYAEELFEWTPSGTRIWIHS